MKKLPYIIVFIFLMIFSCDDKPQYPIKTYEATIFRLKKENDSLKEELQKCDNWVSLLEDNAKGE